MSPHCCIWSTVMGHIQLTTEQLFTVRCMEEARGQYHKEDILDLLKDSKRLLKVKTRYAENPKNLSCLAFSLEEQLNIQLECQRLAEEKTADELFDELIWCNKLIMIKDNIIRQSFKDGSANKTFLFS